MNDQQVTITGAESLGTELCEDHVMKVMWIESQADAIVATDDTTCNHNLL